MSYNLGTAEGVITTSYNSKGVDEANKDVEQLTKKHTSASEAIDKVGRTSGIAGAAIAAGIGVAVGAAANFEQRMSAVQAVSGASGAEMDQLSKKALQLGKDTSFSATDAASAIEELVKAGVSVPDVMNGAADATVALAAAGEVSLPEAAAIASNAMNQFQLSAQDMPKVADLIAGAANASAIDVKDFGMSLSQAGAVAHLVGASFDDTAAAIALMGNAGIKGSDAGTSLKTMLSNLQPQTEKQAALMEQLGLITKEGGNQFFDANGKLKSFSEIAGLLQTSLAGMTSAQKQATLSTIFGSDAIRAAAIFTQAGAKGFDNMAASMNKVKAADVAKTRLDNFKGSLEQLKGSLETTGIIVGQIFLPALRKVVDFLAQVANAFLSLPSGVQKAIAIFVAVVGAALLFVAATVKIVKAVQTVIEVAKVLRTVMASTWAATLGPIALIIAAIALLVVGIIYLWKHSETFRNIVIGVWNAIKTAVSAVAKWFTGTLWPGIQKVWDGIVSGLQAVGSFFSSIWGAIVSGTTAAWNGIAGFLTGLWNSITSGITTAWNAIVSVFTTIWNGIVAVATAIFNGLKAAILFVINAMLAPWRAFWAVFGELITAAWNLVVAIVQFGVGVVLALIKGWLDLTYNLVNSAWKAIQGFLIGSWNAISSAATTIWNAVSGFFTRIFTAIKNFITSVWNSVSSFTSKVWNAVYNAIAGVVNKIKNFITSGFNAAKGFVTSVFNAIASFVTSIWNSIYNAVAGPINRIKSYVNSGLTTAKNFVVGAFKGAYEGTVQWLNNLYDKVAGVVGKVKGIFSGAAGWLIEAGKNIIRGLLKGIESLINSVTDKLKSLTDKIPKVKGPEQRDKKLLRPAGRWIMEGFVDELAKGVDNALSLLSNTTGMIPDTITAKSISEVMPATGLSSAASLVAPASTVAAGKQTTINLDVYNPVGKPAAEELSEQATRLALLGVL